MKVMKAAVAGKQIVPMKKHAATDAAKSGSTPKTVAETPGKRRNTKKTAATDEGVGGNRKQSCAQYKMTKASVDVCSIQDGEEIKAKSDDGDLLVHLWYDKNMNWVSLKSQTPIGDMQYKLK